VQQIHALHGQGFGIIIFMLAEVFERADIEKGCDGDEAASFMEIAPEQEFLVDFFHIGHCELVFFDQPAQFPVLLAMAVDIPDKLLVVQVVTVFFNQAAIGVGTSQRMVHFP
jgi:hypothetical protein